MSKVKECEHEWVFDSKGCCYRLQCQKCPRATTAYYVKGKEPKKGDKVKLVEETIEVIEKE